MFIPEAANVSGTIVTTAATVKKEAMPINAYMHPQVVMPETAPVRMLAFSRIAQCDAGECKSRQPYTPAMSTLAKPVVRKVTPTLLGSDSTSCSGVRRTLTRDQFRFRAVEMDCRSPKTQPRSASGTRSQSMA